MHFFAVDVFLIYQLYMHVDPVDPPPPPTKLPPLHGWNIADTA